MQIELTPQQKNAKAAFRSFVDEEIMPYADKADREEHTPQFLIDKIAEQGYLGAILPKNKFDSGMDMITYGILNEEIGRLLQNMINNPEKYGAVQKEPRR